MWFHLTVFVKTIFNFSPLNYFSYSLNSSDQFKKWYQTYCVFSLNVSYKKLGWGNSAINRLAVSISQAVQDLLSSEC